jgi:nucleotide sugar dehydrogenase
VVGIDVDAAKLRAVNAGRSPVSDVRHEQVRELVTRGALRATDDYAVLADTDAVIICVPTPLARGKRPDLTYVESATRGIAPHLHPDMLVVLQSTSSPGTTRGVMLPILEASGLRVGEDFFLAFAPERIDPGNSQFTVRNTPKLVGGTTPACTATAVELYRRFIDQVTPVSSPEVAELSKLVENTFRFVNISFVNELALLCDRMGVSTWEVIEAASTKPFAFMPHFPSAGVGGHCIPVVPFYLEAAAEEAGVSAGLIREAGRVNDGMPVFVADKAERLLTDRGVDPAEARLLLLGLTYKRDILDLRESAALAVLRELLARGRHVRYHDPLVATVQVDGTVVTSVPLDRNEVRAADCVILLVPHSAIDYELLYAEARLLLDTANRFKGRRRDGLVPL